MVRSDGGCTPKRVKDNKKEQKTPPLHHGEEKELGSMASQILVTCIYPISSKEADLEANLLCALDSVAITSMQLEGY